LRATYDAELVSAASLVNTAKPTLSTARLDKDSSLFSQFLYQYVILSKGDQSPSNPSLPEFSMANLEFVDQHNMVACLAKTEGNSNFHKIVDFLASSSIHHALTACPNANEAYLLQNLALIGGEAEGKGLEEPTEPQPTPSPTQPKVPVPSDRAEGALNLQELSVLCTNLSNKVLALESIKDAQAVEISALKIRIKRLEKKCKPSIFHHRAWLKSVQRLSMKKRFRKKESVSKQGRKKSKPESTLDEQVTSKEVLRDSDLDAAQIAKDAEIVRLVHENELAEMEREREERYRDRIKHL
ncbi:hypothetical protein Tco_1151499, partial [Tanacetum coccineum]